LIKNPIAINSATLAQEQLQDQEQLMQQQMRHPLQFPNTQFQDIQASYVVLAYQPNLTEPWNICIPTTQ
jgi:hypothetical protein